MRKLSTIVSFLAMTTLFSTALAGDWHYGATVGYENVSLFTQNKGEKIDYNNASGFNVGAVIAYNPIEYLSIQSGITFVMNGYKYTAGTFIEKYKTLYSVTEETKLFYLNFPVYVIGKIPAGNAYINVEVGPNLYAGVGSHSKVTVQAGNQEYNSSDNLFDSALDRFNCTLHLAGGVEYSGFRLMAGYNFALYNIELKKVRESEDDYYKLGGFVVNISYLF